MDTPSACERNLESRIFHNISVGIELKGSKNNKLPTEIFQKEELEFNLLVRNPGSNVCSKTELSLRNFNLMSAVLFHLHVHGFFNNKISYEILLQPVIFIFAKMLISC